MIAGLDSAQPPTAAQVAAARMAGVGLWSGYLATSGQGGSAFNLLRVWTRAEFDVARGAGGPPIAFCSGWDDPLACRYLADAWGVRLCLDVEDQIRPDGPWVQPWLDYGHAGLYGNYGVHIGRTATFHILADYPGTDPADVWLPATGWYRPPGPLGWQWQGSHQEFNLDVDRGWYDDWFGGNLMVGLDPNDPAVAKLLVLANLSDDLKALHDTWVTNSSDPANPTALDRFETMYNAALDVQQRVAALQAGGVPSATLQPVLDALGRLEAALKGAGGALGGA